MTYRMSEGAFRTHVGLFHVTTKFKDMGRGGARVLAKVTSLGMTLCASFETHLGDLPRKMHRRLAIAIHERGIAEAQWLWAKERHKTHSHEGPQWDRFLEKAEEDHRARMRATEIAIARVFADARGEHGETACERRWRS